MTVRVSAIVCTFNRPEYLRTAIQSLVDQSITKDQFEILVIDNGSADKTRKVVCGHFANVPNVRYLEEPVLGLSQSRNTGWRNARGEYVAYLDDDAVAQPQWLETILEVFDTVRPTPGCVGGKVMPLWEAPRPSWLTDRLVGYVGCPSLPDYPTALGDAEWIVGCNSAYPRAILEMLGGFQVDLGRRGSNLMSMEENLLQQRLIDEGYSRFSHPGIAVRHHVHASRLTKTWFFRRMYWEGASAAIARMHQEPTPLAARLRTSIATAKARVLSPRSLACLALPTQDPGRFDKQCSIWMDMGYVAGMLGIAR